MSDKPAVEGGKRVRYTPLAFAKPFIGEEEIAEVVSTIRSGWLTAGPKTKEFEKKFAEYVAGRAGEEKTGKALHAIAVNSCTAALHLSLAALGVGRGDEVIVPALTFASTANVAVHLGAKPVFVDVSDNGTGNIDAAKIESAITKKTKAIIPVHYAGHACDMDAVSRVAEKHGMAVVEDAAHACGSEYKRRKIGSLESFASCFSFYATKNLATGEGGMICSRDEEKSALMRRLSLHGMSKDAWNRYSDKGSWYYEVTEAGFKDNMTDLQASIGLHQLAKLDKMNEMREKIALNYNQHFGKMKQLIAPSTKSYCTKHSWHLYSLRLRKGALKINRSEFIDALKAEGILASVHFIPVHLHPFYKKTFGYKQGDFPVAEEFYENEVSLPLYPGMSGQDARDVVEAVKKIVEWYSK